MRRTLTIALVSMVAAGCGSDSPTESAGGNNALSARVDGQQWTASAVEASRIGNIVMLSGNDGVIDLALSATTTGTGTYDLTAGSALGQLTEAGSVWYAVGLDGSGTITFESLDANGASGTFTFTAGPVGNSATGTRSITNGTFDVEF